MLTPQEEYEYYLGQATMSELLALRDSDYKIVAARFRTQAERWKKKIILVSTPTGGDTDPIYKAFKEQKNEKS